MVKLVVQKERREAAFEAEKRTISISSKQSMFGLPLIDMDSSRSNTSSNDVFTSERFIFGEIRPYLIRSAVDRCDWNEISSTGRSGGVGAVAESRVRIIFDRDGAGLVHLDQAGWISALGVDSDVALVEGLQHLVPTLARNAVGRYRFGEETLVCGVLTGFSKVKSSSVNDHGVNTGFRDEGVCYCGINGAPTSPLRYQQSMATGPPSAKLAVWDFV
eukprot:TRINITY_DN240_c0_g2_i12.p1 TRINITY_DN240_c0_g2~~TRINITY_DN240_c0_g2_i12.p1  ORF type:complete len:217 (+),score=27.84 TRINITY_DN240_c0_g2_i12:2228-2878(+)